MITQTKQDFKKISYVFLFSLTLFSQAQATSSSKEDLLDELEKKPKLLYEIYGVPRKSEIEKDLQSKPQGSKEPSKITEQQKFFQRYRENEELYLNRLDGLDNNYSVQQAESLINFR